MVPLHCGMQADLEEDNLLAERLSSHGQAGFSQAGIEAISAGPSHASSGSLSAPIETLADMQDPLGMGVIDARNCTLVSESFQHVLPYNIHTLNSRLTMCLGTPPTFSASVLYSML